MMVELKGNYPLASAKKERDESKENKGKTSIEEEFENKSLKKLGGSIAFVVKSKSLVWDGKDE